VFEDAADPLAIETGAFVCRTFFFSACPPAFIIGPSSARE